MRPLSWRLLMSFERDFDDNVDFFTIGQSQIGGTDFIRPNNSDVVTEWDKYSYVDYTSRIISVEVTHEEEPYFSVRMATADIELDNHDNFFTPGAGSSIDGDILPYRPVRILMGFGGETVPMFIGLTEKMPEINEKSKTVKFHCIDFLYSIFNRPLESESMYLASRTDEILEGLLNTIGLLPGQYELDTGYNTITFAYFEAGMKFGEAARKLMQAEQGVLYLDELGIIRFKNRQDVNTFPVYSFTPSNIIDISVPKEDDIINVVEISSDVREIPDDLISYVEVKEAIEVPANSSVDYWVNFPDPVPFAAVPELYTVATSSMFIANTLADGSGSDVTTNISISNDDLFSTSYLLTFTNTNAFTVYITSLSIFARPAQVVNEIRIREEDTTSVGKYDERVYTIDNDYFSNETEARTRALTILNDYAEYGDIRVLEVKGCPALQLGDAITLNLDGTDETYNITKMVDTMADNRYGQTITLKKFDSRQAYFTIGESLIGGSDVIAP